MVAGGVTVRCIVDITMGQREGSMRYILFILSIMGFVIWDVSSNSAHITGPAAWFAYRVAGGA